MGTWFENDYDFAKHNIRIVKLNVDEDGVRDLATEHGVSGIPHVEFYKDGSKTGEKLVGFDKAKLETMIKKFSG